MLFKKIYRIIFTWIFICECYANIDSIGKDSSCTDTLTFIFISDTQKPMWFEKLFVKTHRNEEATDILLNDIVSRPEISAVLILGDVTAMSSFENNWIKIDTFLANLNKKNIPAYAVMGNHDCLLSTSQGEQNFSKRFPAFVKTGYTVRIKQCAVVMLNSNFSEMSQKEIKYQDEWYQKELDELEKDSTVQLIIVGCHHSPYCNSNIVGPSKKVRTKFVPAFSKNKKCKFFLSGHAHTFQHFMDSLNNKHFIVLGGGGGLLHRLNGDVCHGLKDQTNWGKDYRMFHYLQCKVIDKKILLEVMMLRENLEGPYSAYKFNDNLSSE